MGPDAIAEGLVQPEQAPIEIETSPTEVEREPRSIEQTVREAVETVKTRDAEAGKGDGSTDPSRVRDEKGRFVKAEQTSEVEASPAPAELTPAPVEAAPVVEEVSPPQFWKPETREAFSKVPVEVRKPLVEEYENLRSYVARTADQYNQSRARIEHFEKVIQPRVIRLGLEEGRDPNEAFGNMLDWHEFLKTAPKEAAPQFLQRYGIDLREYANDPTIRAQATPAVPPEIAQELQELRSEVSEIRELPKREQAQAIATEVQKWRSEIDASGKRLRPHVDDLEHIMEPIIARKRQENPATPPVQLLQAAYEEAAWAHPQARESMLKQRRDADEKARVEQQKERAALAKRASVSVRSGSSGTSAKSTKGESWEQTFRKAAQQVNGRA